MKSLLKKLRRFLASQDGPTAVEYAVMLSLIVVACLSAITSIGTKASSVFSKVANSIHWIGIFALMVDIELARRNPGGQNSSYFLPLTPSARFRSCHDCVGYGDEASALSQPRNWD